VPAARPLPPALRAAGAALLGIPLLGLTLVGHAIAGEADHAALDAGDLAWGRADRPAARAAWTTAAESDDAAVIAMAELRLLLVSGNLGLAVHGPRADRALSACPTADPWCELALADYGIFPSLIGLPSDLHAAAAAAARAEGRLPGPAVARLVLLGRAPAERLVGRADLDGLGRVLLEGGGWPAGPGTWVLGLSPVGATGLGAGGGLRLQHPDTRLRGGSLSAGLTLTSALFGSADLSLQGAGDRAWAGALSASRLPLGASRSPAWLGAAALRRQRTAGPWEASVGALAHLDGGEGLGLGPVLRGALHPRDGAAVARQTRLGAELEGSAWSYPFLRGGLDLRSALPGDPLSLHMRATAEWAPVARAAPVARLPAAGGGPLLRSGAWSAWRDTDAQSLVLELRSPSRHLVEGVAFIEGARIDGLHGGLGAGLRLNLPPRPHATTRLDLAWGDGGLGISAGLGEAF
jgi:hypothetical protein